MSPLYKNIIIDEQNDILQKCSYLDTYENQYVYPIYLITPINYLILQ